MTEERDKLLQIMSSLESDYKSGKISPEKYRYFRSKYEDKLKVCKINVDDAQDVAGKYHVMSIPCFVFFKDGQEVHRTQDGLLMSAGQEGGRGAPSRPLDPDPEGL